MINTKKRHLRKNTANTNDNNLAGVGNHINHQIIISDLIFGIRKKFAREHEDKYYVISEVSISELGYKTKKFSHNHNIDLVIAEKGSNEKTLHFILEIEKGKNTKKDTEKKLRNV